jgi:hypothetical protein
MSTPNPTDPSAESLTIEGHLGLVPDCELDIRPLTVLIGKQGSGKSLVSQILYFFRDLPFLIAYQLARLTGDETGAMRPHALIGSTLDGLRSSRRSFTVFANPKVKLTWTNDLRRSLGLHIVASNRQILADAALKAYVLELKANTTQGAIPRGGIFVPTERLFYSQMNSAVALQVLSLPTTFHLFAEWMELAGRIHDGWAGGAPESPEIRWIRERGQTALAGEGYRRGNTWKWRVEGARGPIQFDIDMASSGQRANWPLVLLAQVLMSMRGSATLTANPCIYVEEPEIHLHPEAQVAVIHILALLVRHGFRVVITTHSLTVLYALNNLIQASHLADAPAEHVPPPEVRLGVEQVAAYVLRAGETPVDLVDRESGFIDEAELGRVSEDLSDELNRIGRLSAKP